MTEANTQAVVDDTQTAPVAAAEVDNARDDDLASFLNEYETTTRPAPSSQPEPKPQATDETSVVMDLKSRLDSFEAKEAKQKNDQDFGNAVKKIKGDLDVPDFIVRGWLLDQAKDKKAVDKIWDNRESDPAAFNRMLDKMGKEFAATTSKVLGKQVDSQATEDRTLVAAAVRGSSTKVPENKPPSFGAMSNGEFRQHVNDTYGFDPGV